MLLRVIGWFTEAFNNANASRMCASTAIVKVDRRPGQGNVAARVVAQGVIASR